MKLLPPVDLGEDHTHPFPPMGIFTLILSWLLRQVGEGRVVLLCPFCRCGDPHRRDELCRHTQSPVSSRASAASGIVSPDESPWQRAPKRQDTKNICEFVFRMEAVPPTPPPTSRASSLGDQVLEASIISLCSLSIGGWMVPSPKRLRQRLCFSWGIWTSWTVWDLGGSPDELQLVRTCVCVCVSVQVHVYRKSRARCWLSPAVTL